MNIEQEYIGKRFGRLLVRSATRIKNSRGSNVVYYDCLCDCGNSKLITRSSLKSGLTKSCGCYKTEQTKLCKTTHGKTKSKEYSIWAGMVKRCTNSNCKGYKNYGGRGITVDLNWLKFDNFYKDMGECPIGYSLERIDVNKGYYKENCKWIPTKTQARNKTTTVKITYQGRTLLADEWSSVTGIPRRCIHDRLKKGWSVEDALTVKSKDGRVFKEGIEYKGRKVTYAQLEREKGYSDSLITKRLADGWSLEEAVETPVQVTMYEFLGETKTLKQWAEVYRLRVDLVRQRLKADWTLEEALTTPCKHPAKLYTVGNKTQSLIDWALDIGISEKNLKRKLKSGLSLEYIVSIKLTSK